MNTDIKIACPNCDWEPDGKPYWMCTRCRHSWDTFATAAVCPNCKHAHIYTSCIPFAGGCNTSSPHEDWYRGLDAWLAEELAKIRESVLVDA